MILEISKETGEQTDGHLGVSFEIVLLGKRKNTFEGKVLFTRYVIE